MNTLKKSELVKIVSDAINGWNKTEGLDRSGLFIGPARVHRLALAVADAIQGADVVDMLLDE